MSRFGSIAPLGMLETCDAGPMEYVLRTSLHHGVVVRNMHVGGCLWMQGINNYYFSNGAPQAPEIMMMKETTGCLIRMLCPCVMKFGCQEWELNLGETGEGALIAKFDRPCCAPPAPMKCCYQQRVNVSDASGKDLGQAKEATCWRGVPKANIWDPNGNCEYELHQPTCLCGTRVDYCGLGLKGWLLHLQGKWSPPTMISDPAALAQGEEKGRITHLVGAVESRLTGQMALLYETDAYQIKIPKGSAPDKIARVLAAFIYHMHNN